MSALDELLRSWRANPDAEATVALCTALGGANRAELMDEVRGVVQQWHATDARVLLRVGLMFLEAGALVEAQAAFVSAGRADGTRPDAFRYLGEVLLRRGDAVRASKVLARALGLVPGDQELGRWHERARMYSTLQSRVGMEAVAKEVARAVPLVVSRPPPPLPKVASSSEAAPRPPVLAPVSTTSIPPALSPAGRAPTPRAGGLDRGEDAGDPRPEEILSQLALVGVFDGASDGVRGEQLQWERPPRQRSRSVWVLAGAAVLVAGGAVGAVGYARAIAEERVAEATALCDEIAATLRAGEPDAIAATDERLSRVFELDPSGQRAARLWLENRVMHWLVRGTSDGIEGAIQRLRRLGASAEEVAFGTLAVRLADGDVPGALGLLPETDAAETGDPLYELLAGVALERVGDARSLERYEAAVTGDGGLRVARVLRARALLAMGRAAEAKAALEAVEAGSVERRALELLAATLAPPGDDREPSSAGATAPSPSELPALLRWIPSLWQARLALAGGSRSDADRHLKEGLEAADTPDAAVRFGDLALAADAPALVRQAALRAMSLSSVHRGGRLLAARAALDLGRYEEALQSLEGLEAGGGDALALRAVVAYERGDAVGLGDVVDALRAQEGDVRAHPAVELFPALLLGEARLLELPTERLVRPETLWGRLALADAALLQGRPAQAQEHLSALPPRSAPVARRLAQLARLGGALEDANGHGAPALEDSPTSLALIERVLCLLSAARVDEARAVVTERGSLIGPLAQWLSVLADLEQGALPRAKARAATLAEPPAESPLALRLAVARALVGIGDRARAAPALALLRRQAPRHPEVTALPARL